MAISEESYIGRGLVFLGQVGEKLIPVGSAKKLDLATKVDTQKLKDYTVKGGGLRNVTSTISDGTGTLVMDDINPTNLATALLGDASAITAGAVVDEMITASKGGLNLTANIGISAVVVKSAQALSASTYSGTATPKSGNTGSGIMGTVTASSGAVAGTYRVIITEAITHSGEFTVLDPAGAFVGQGTVGSAFSEGGIAFTLAQSVTDPVVDWIAGDEIRIAVTIPGFGGSVVTYVPDTDYTVSGAGFIIPTGSAITEGESLKVSYSYPAQHVIEAMTHGQREYRLVFDGWNEAQGELPVVVQVHRIKLDPASALSLITDAYGELSTNFSFLKDDKQPVGKSQFYKVTKTDKA